MMKTLKSCVQSVETKCLGTTMDFSPVKAARFCTNYSIKNTSTAKMFQI